VACITFVILPCVYVVGGEKYFWFLIFFYEAVGDILHWAQLSLGI